MDHRECTEINPYIYRHLMYDIIGITRSEEKMDFSLTVAETIGICMGKNDNGPVSYITHKNN